MSAEMIKDLENRLINLDKMFQEERAEQNLVKMRLIASRFNELHSQLYLLMILIGKEEQDEIWKKIRSKAQSIRSTQHNSNKI